MLMETQDVDPEHLVRSFVLVLQIAVTYICIQLGKLGVTKPESAVNLRKLSIKQKQNMKEKTS